MTRWTRTAPRIARVTRRAERPVCADDRGDVLAAVAALAARVDEYNTHIGHMNAAAIGDNLESRMSQQELSGRVASLVGGYKAVAGALGGLTESMTKADTERDRKITNLAEVVADLALAVDGLGCREDEVA